MEPIVGELGHDEETWETRLYTFRSLDFHINCIFQNKQIKLY